ncbi:MAG: DNA mismatch repair endonuclease MutL [Candidatus Eiseniibacteriota bacterium]
MTAPVVQSRIQRLDPRTASRIAAGEVLDRPSAALKELVENALDAGARTIEITVEGGLDRAFEIADDGSGMAAEELPLALERHATSKIRSLEDLDALSTLGFRGEALPSIGEVSRLTITTRTRDAGPAGHSIAIEGGVVGAVAPAGRAPGTTVSVRDLFFNTPARRKFLRSPAAELRLAVRLLTAYALAFPDVGFRLVVDGKPRLQLPAASSMRDRLVAVFGTHFVDRLIEVREERPGFLFEAWLGVPELARVTREGQTLLVNRRWIQSPFLSQAVRQGYGNLIPPARHPTAILSLTIDPATIDVNVHPTKREIRFAREDAIFGFVAQRVARPLSKLAPRYLPTPSREAGPPTLDELTGGNRQQGSLFAPRRAGGPGLRGAIDVITGGGSLAGGTGATAGAGGLRLIGPEDGTGDAGEGGEGVEAVEAPGAGATPEGTEPAPEGEVHASARLPDLWQLHETYILAPIAGALLIVDQHAAHERILYEEALRRFQSKDGASQGLLFGFNVDLSRDEFDLLLEVQPALEALGFDLTAMSPPTVAIRSVPAGIVARDAGSLLRDLLDGLGEAHGRSLTRDEPWDRVAKSFACHAAVRAGDRLSREEMSHLIDRLFATKLPHGDPHGRPTFVRVDLHELNQRFGRSDG